MRPTLGRIAGIGLPAVLAATLAGVLQAPPPAAAVVVVPDSWHATQSMHYARGQGLTATKLQDGRVLVVGGLGDGQMGVSIPEIWDPTTGAWTLSPMPSPAPKLARHTATLLSNGKVLVAGGYDNTTSTFVSKAWLWSAGPTAAGTWTLTGSMHVGRADHVAAAIGSKVLVVGGRSSSDTTISSAEIYDPATGAFAWAADPGVARFGALVGTARWGNILVAGGTQTTCSAGSCTLKSLGSAQLYDPIANSWSSAGSMISSRSDGAIAGQNGGALFVVGGRDFEANAISVSSQSYSPQGDWQRNGNLFAQRWAPTATTLDDDSVVVAGGMTDKGPGDVEVYDPYLGAFRPAAPMLTPRYYAAAVHVAGNQVLVVGGFGNSGVLKSAEVYMPAAQEKTYTAGTYHAVTPKRIVDSRIGLGLSHALSANTIDAFNVTGGGSPVPLNAVAITGILTETKATGKGYLTLGTIVTNSSYYSTINFPAGDDRANNVTIAVRQYTPQNILSIRYYSSTPAAKVDVVFDVTGYFTPDTTGATYYPVTPGRFLDTRYGIGYTYLSGMPWVCGQTGKIKSGCSRMFKISTFTASNGTTVPFGAVAVTGNVTAVKPTSKGFLSFQAGTSVLNLPAGEIRANGVTLPIGGQSITVTWNGTSGSTVDVVFDVTGYFMPGTGGAKFYPIDPIRLLDSRFGDGLFGPLPTKSPRSFPVASRGAFGFFLPAEAKAIAGNLTIVDQTSAGYASVGPSVAAVPDSSNLNIPAGDIRANGFDARLNSSGNLGIVWVGTAGSKAQAVVDVTGYWK